MSTITTRSSSRTPLAEVQEVQTPKAPVRAHKRTPDAPRKKPAYSGHKTQKKHQNDLNEKNARWREVAEFESRLVAVADDPLWPTTAEEVPPPSDDEVYSDPEWEADDAPPVVLRLQGVESRKRSAPPPPCPRPRRGCKSV
jgi:hypothetical protein